MKRVSKSFFTCVAFSSDGNKVAAGGFDHMVRVWDISSAQEVACLVGHGDIVQCVAFSQDGKRVVSGSGSKCSKYNYGIETDISVRVWDLAMGAEMFMVRIPTPNGYATYGKEVNSVAFSPDDQRITAGVDDEIITWNVSTHLITWKIPLYRECVERLEYSPDGKLLFTRSGVSYEPDGKKMDIGLGQRRVRIWDVETLTCIEVIDDRWDVDAIAMGALRMPWRITEDGVDTAIKSVATGNTVAWFPSGPHIEASCPTGVSWALTWEKSLYILSLQGAPVVKLEPRRYEILRERLQSIRSNKPLPRGIKGHWFRVGFQDQYDWGAICKECGDASVDINRASRQTPPSQCPRCGFDGLRNIKGHWFRVTFEGEYSWDAQCKECGFRVHIYDWGAIAKECGDNSAYTNRASRETPPSQCPRCGFDGWNEPNEETQ